MAGGTGFGGSADDELISSINVTPLVDVVLVLLIIFMITAPAIYQSAIRVQLPKATTGEDAKNSRLSFSINKEGQVFWDKDPVDWQLLGKRLSALSPNISEQTAVISADQATSHGIVIRLMDTLRQAGLTRFALNVEVAALATELKR